VKDLVEALTIFLKYSATAATHCERDVLMVVGVTEDDVSSQDAKRLDALGFFWADDCWQSFRHGSA
jgi:hypothetical protein